MVKRAKRGVDGPSWVVRDCYLCKKSHTGPQELCAICERRLKSMNSSEAPESDQKIMTIIKESRQRERARLVENLSRPHTKCIQGFKTKQNELKRERDQLIKRARKLEKKLKLLAPKPDKNKSVQTRRQKMFDVNALCKNLKIKEDSQKRSHQSNLERQNKPQTDYAKLVSLLSRPDIVERLQNVGDIALRTEFPNLNNSTYTELGGLFCDGICLELGKVPAHIAKITQTRLQADMQKAVQQLIIKHILLQQSALGSQVWITFTPESAALTHRQIHDIWRLVDAARNHAKLTWHYQPDELKAITLKKVDETQDYTGSFIPEDHQMAFIRMKQLLELEVNDIFNDHDKNFLHNGFAGDLKVKKGRNYLPTCLPFEIYDSGNDKLFTIKVYDKILDLISRDGGQMVGSKVNYIVGSKMQLTSFNRKIQKAEELGITRMELSIHEAALNKYSMNQPLVQNKFYKRVTRCMRDLRDRFLNEQEVWVKCYRKVNISRLLAGLAMTPVNILAIGKKECWLINARTPHPRHFVGSHCTNSLYQRTTELTQWDRLKYFVSKFASLGARVDVYWLHQGRPKIEKCDQFFKVGDVKVSLPGCTLPFLNGLKLASFIDTPVKEADAKRFIFKNWIPTVRCIAKSIEREQAREQEANDSE